MENFSKRGDSLDAHIILFWENLSNHEVGVNGSYLGGLVESHSSLKSLYHKTQLTLQNQMYTSRPTSLKRVQEAKVKRMQHDGWPYG